jgi:hypothetical protein
MGCVRVPKSVEVYGIELKELPPVSFHNLGPTPFSSVSLGSPPLPSQLLSGLYDDSGPFLPLTALECFYSPDPWGFIHDCIWFVIEILESA